MIERDDDATLREHGRIALALLLAEPVELDVETVGAMLALYDEELAKAEIEALSGETSLEAIFVARIDRHTVAIRVLDSPVLEVVIEPSIQLGHYDVEIKDRARAHRGAIIVEYLGVCDPAIIASVVVAAVAGALAPLGAVVVANARAKTSVPAALLSKSTEDMISYLRALPPLLLYAGFGKYEVEGQPGVWMRTHGNAALMLPDFARHTSGHQVGQETFALFSDMMLYLLGSQTEMSAGDVAQVGEDQFSVLRHPEPGETFLDESDGPVLVVEILDHAELTRLKA